VVSKPAFPNRQFLHDFSADAVAYTFVRKVCAHSSAVLMNMNFLHLVVDRRAYLLPTICARWRSSCCLSSGVNSTPEFRPDVVLSDVGLPGMDGYQVARAFRADAALRNMFLVALTGYALPEDSQRATEAGFQRHLAKPLSLQALEDLLAAPESETGLRVGGES